ncbi:Zinc-ribbon containing domain-containing protein [Allopseudospirillum japonicum]|uniref:Zinc-ribbon containing domain-containing protein n=1 Tax=Allopseudospirillum japonicum TaxID=64971 RepID=A0A1H6QP46_9GAMM|nr:hypothetical protein [Allopseudospirillum japonicum]SEI41220.1 Zinc-ribbon containing domain-containing protein [Allopseudospirillum japonicum]
MSKSPLNERLTQGYAHLWQNLQLRLAQWEETAAANLHDELEKALVLAQGVHHLAQDELALLRAYAQRDLTQMGRFMQETGQGVKEWIALDTEILEQQALHALQEIADKTSLEQLTLLQDLDARDNPSLYHAGELALPGHFTCTECGKKVVMQSPQILDTCHRCQGRIFTRESQS